MSQTDTKRRVITIRRESKTVRRPIMDQVYWTTFKLRDAAFVLKIPVNAVVLKMRMEKCESVFLWRVKNSSDFQNSKHKMPTRLAH